MHVNYLWTVCLQQFTLKNKHAIHFCFIVRNYSDVERHYYLKHFKVPFAPCDVLKVGAVSNLFNLFSFIVIILSSNVLHL